MSRAGLVRIGRVVVGSAGDVAILCGLGLVAFGTFEIYQPAGFIISGIELATLAWLLDRRG